MTQSQHRRPVFAAFAVSRTGNRGAVSMLEATIDHLASEPVNGVVHVFTVYPKDDAQLPPEPNVRLHSGTPQALIFKLIPLCLLYRLARLLRLPIPDSAWGRDMQALLETDVCLMIGGTTFNDAKPIKVPWNVACLLPAILLRRKAMMYSQTLGPFRKALNRWAARWCLKRMDFIAPRGPGSLEHVRGLGLGNKIEYLPDSAFSLRVSPEVEQEIRQRYAGWPRGKGVVGVSINTIVEARCKELGIDHHGAFVELMRRLLDEGYRIWLIPHSMRPGSKLRHNNDLVSLAEILDRLGRPEGVHVIDEPYDCKRLRVLVGLTDYYVACRFHSMISALCTGVPVATFGWGHQKYIEVLHEFELDGYFWDGAELSGSALIAAFERIVREADSMRERMRRNLPRVQAASAANHQAACRLAGVIG